MRILHPTTLGDLIDKLSIILIKIEKIDSKDHRVNYLEEEKKHIIDSLTINKIEFNKINEWKDLLETNKKLWDYEFEIRENPEMPCHKKGIHLNDLRHIIKNKINSSYKSTLEVKLHENLSCNSLDN